MLKCIAYISTATCDFDAEELADLSKLCSSHNAVKGITGILCYHNYSFLQFLEGDPINIIEVYRRIGLDQRHKNVVKLFDQAISRRAFPDWGMGLTRWDDLDAVQKAVFQDLSQVNLCLEEVDDDYVERINTFLFGFKKKRN